MFAPGTLFATVFAVVWLTTASPDSLRDAASVGEVETEDDSTEVMMPIEADTVSIEAVRAVSASEGYRVKHYEIKGTGGFTVRVLTPVCMEFARKRAQDKFAEKLLKLRRKSDPDTATISYTDPFEEVKTCMQTRSGAYYALVAVTIEPDVGESSGSFWRSVFAGTLSGIAGRPVPTTKSMKYKGHFLRAELLRGEEPIAPVWSDILDRSMDYHKDTFSWETFSTYMSVEGNDTSHAGVYLYDPEEFRPSGSSWPQLSLLIVDVEYPEEPLTVDVDQKTMERIYLDMQPFLESRTKR